MRLAMCAGSVAISIAAMGCGGGDDAGSCDASALMAELAAASSGDTVQVGQCALTGSFTVPPGVTLSGAAGSVLRADDGVVVKLEPSPDPATPTTLSSVTIEADGRVGVLSRGAGAVSVRGVTMMASRGYGIAIESATTATLEDVTLTGPVTADNSADDVFLTADPATMATFGVILLAAGTVEMTRVEVIGFAEFGVAALDQTADGMPPAVRPSLAWSVGGARETLGTGLYVAGSDVALLDVELMSTFRGLRGTAAYGAVFAGESAVTSMRLVVCDNDGFGLLHEGGTAHHTDLSLTNNGEGGLAAGSAMSLELDGGDSILSENGGFNVLIRDSSNVALRDLLVERAIRSPTALGPELGDGIQLIGTYDNVVLENLVIRDNERVALTVDIGPAMGEGITFTNVMVHSYMAELGAIGGTVDTATWELVPVAPDGAWDAGITRDSSSLMADAAFATRLAVAGIITPSMIARPDGIAGIITPSM